jgi:hypothetical protein
VYLEDLRRIIDPRDDQKGCDSITALALHSYITIISQNM